MYGVSKSATFTTLLRDVATYSRYVSVNTRCIKEAFTTGVVLTTLTVRVLISKPFLTCIRKW